jgi:hypothetical protein
MELSVKKGYYDLRMGMFGKKVQYPRRRKHKT